MKNPSQNNEEPIKKNIKVEKSLNQPEYGDKPWQNLQFGGKKSQPKVSDTKDEDDDEMKLRL